MLLMLPSADAAMASAALDLVDYYCRYRSRSSSALSSSPIAALSAHTVKPAARPTSCLSSSGNSSYCAIALARHCSEPISVPLARCAAPKLRSGSGSLIALVQSGSGCAAAAGDIAISAYWLPVSSGSRMVSLVVNGASSADNLAPTAVSEQVKSVANEELFYPSDEFRASALISSREQYDNLYKRSVEDPDGFWADIASNFFWKTKWDDSNGKIHSENVDIRKGRINIEWFKGGKTNICYNAVDRHVEAGRGDDIAILWEGNEPGDEKTLTYKDLLGSICQLANYLRTLGVRKGDAVAIYMPMITDLPVAMLACSRIGAVHSVVFGGFSADALSQRITDCRAKVLLTTSGVCRGSKVIKLKEIVDEALSLCLAGGHTLESVLVFPNDSAIKRQDTPWIANRDIWWPDVVPDSIESPIEWVDAEDPLFLLYTSGSTGKPKGVLHTTGGYMVYTATTFKYAFDYRKGDVYWCTADCGWITGHSYVTYGPFLNGATVVVFEGVPTYPDASRCWEIVEKYKVNILYTAPTAIRALMRFGDQFVKPLARKSLRVLGSVGEPINPSAWSWYYEVVGDRHCPIVDTWWQTETGGFMITPLPGAWPLKPGSATLPFLGVQPAIVDEKGNELEGECSGYLCIKASWPGAFRTLYEAHERYETTYFSPFQGYYFSGDGCRRDKDGYYWLTGRVDDVINVSGHRIGTAEVESALVSHPLCTEAAVVGYEHEVKGQGIYAFVTLLEGVPFTDKLRKALILTVREQVYCSSLLFSCWSLHICFRHKLSISFLFLKNYV
ncbi:hypothetical protein O6H91_22G049100 [Diphasiastrum complanatum]|uniref:Uncharacterized protein n=2 Tax=Diphasiastrum complanatum TaxID=34168 RepID=A0ACC2AFA0_DIPCM|nr:hypothetical protein O6H91_22G049100 [Diphasiastrum complanatum]KAJ7516244.1 hypothetical protein O6H91_22G049100 [Diphasiastrum complanatum]